MNYSNEKIKDMFNLKFDINYWKPEQQTDNIVLWYGDMIEKTYDELSLFDVTRMIIQKELLEIAVDKAIDFLLDDPACGQRYDNELLKLVLDIDDKFLKNRKTQLDDILKKAKTIVDEVDWILDEDREEFIELTQKLENKLRKF